MRMKLYGIIASILLLGGCYHLEIDSVPKWCDHIEEVDLEEKYSSFWALFTPVSFHEDKVRDDFVAIMNETHMEKVENRSPRMAWREETAFHLINLSSLLVIEPEKIIEEWQNGIEKAKTHSHDDNARACIYGVVTALFDSMHIHSIEVDFVGKQKTDHITIIQIRPTGSKEQLRLEPSQSI